MGRALQAIARDNKVQILQLQMEGAIALSALLFCPRCRMNNNDVLLSIKHCRKGSAVLDEEAVSLKRNEPRGETRCLHAALSQTRALAA